MPATSSYQVLALLSADMDEAEQAAVWTLVRCLRNKEMVTAWGLKVTPHSARDPEGSGYGMDCTVSPSPDSHLTIYTRLFRAG